MSNPDDGSLASAKIDLRFMITLAVLFAGALLAWAANREAVKQNAVDIAELTQTVAILSSEMAKLSERVLTIENGMSYRAGAVDQINAKIDRVISAIAEPRPSSAQEYPR